MPQAGVKTLALWREAGEWWRNDPPRTIHRYIDGAGIRREEIAVFTRPERPKREGEKPRIRHTRDEKVATACGHAEVPNFGSLSKSNAEKSLLPPEEAKIAPYEGDDLIAEERHSP